MKDGEWRVRADTSITIIKRIIYLVFVIVIRSVQYFPLIRYKLLRAKNGDPDL